jgi:hypothetical protein
LWTYLRVGVVDVVHVHVVVQPILHNSRAVSCTLWQ